MLFEHLLILFKYLKSDFKIVNYGGTKSQVVVSCGKARPRPFYWDEAGFSCRGELSVGSLGEWGNGGEVSP